MKTIPLIVMLGACALVCGETFAQDQPAKPPAAEKDKSSGYWEKLTMQPFLDSKGMVTLSMPFPSTWKIERNRQPNGPTITGPDGIQVYDFPLRTFLFTSDPSMQQVYTRSGTQLRPPPQDIGTLVRQDLVPSFGNMGLKLIKHYEIPELTRIDQWYNDQLFKAVPGTNKCIAIGSDWENANGGPHFVITHYMVGYTPALTMWSYWCTGLQSEKAPFPKAKQQLIFSLANARYNPEQIMAYNKSEAEKAGKSWADFNRRMAANQAAFEANQRAHVNRTNAINDAIMNGWRERNAASDRNQERFIDTINERTNVVDPTSGRRYKVDAGANHYWMNSDGKYISSNQQMYDPNLDEALNRQNWQKLENADQ